VSKERIENQLDFVHFANLLREREFEILLHSLFAVCLLLKLHLAKKKQASEEFTCSRKGTKTLQAKKEKIR
jgi:hypothetical protein